MTCLTYVPPPRLQQATDHEGRLKGGAGGAPTPPAANKGLLAKPINFFYLTTVDA